MNPSANLAHLIAALTDSAADLTATRAATTTAANEIAAALASTQRGERDLIRNHTARAAEHAAVAERTLRDALNHANQYRPSL